MQTFDAIIIGYGPTGKVLARLLSDAGHSVAIVERWPAAYPLPRAVGYDHEIKRMLHKLGVAKAAEAVSRPMHHYVWYNQDWKVLVDIDESQPSISGGPRGYLFNQPELEKILEEDLSGRPGITLFTSHTALEITQSEDASQVIIAPCDGIEPIADDAVRMVLEAAYVIGCDGANSLARKTIGSKMFDHGFDADWLVVDVMPQDDAKLPIPDAAQWCNPARPTTIVPSGVKNRRWEFMVMPGETPEDIAEEDNVWDLLSPWMTPSDGMLIRRATYNFRSRLAQGWRDRRIMIAGDAAHQMPPFMGQGMCSGLRDAWTLGWKLNAVLAGRADPALLDTYETERAPHVDTVIRISMAMGQIVCVPDAQAAAARDAAFFAGAVPPPPAFPGLSGGMIDTREDGTPRGIAGQLLPHSDLSDGTKTTRMDDLVAGHNFVLLVRDLPHDTMTDSARAALQALNCTVIALGTRFTDTTGRLDALFDDTGAKAILARPDFYAFGTATTAAETEAMLGRAAEFYKRQ